MKGKEADERVWKRYMVLCNLDEGSQGVDLGSDSSVSEDCQDTLYENGYDDFAMVML